MARVLAGMFGFGVEELLGPPESPEVADDVEEFNAVVRRSEFLANVVAASVGAVAPEELGRLRSVSTPSCHGAWARRTCGLSKLRPMRS